MPKQRAVPAVCMLDRIKRLVLQHFLVGRRRCYPINRIDLVRQRTPSVWHDAIFGLRLRQQNRFGALLIQIDHRRAAELECVGRDVSLQRAVRLVEIKVQLQSAAGVREGRAVENQVEEQKLFWKGEILGQQAIAGKGLRSIGKHALVGLETDRLNRGYLQRSRGLVAWTV